MITMHDIAIRSLTAQHPTLETRRFMAAVREAIGPEDYDFEAGQSKIHIRPDAYKIHASDQVIVCFEVEYGHPVSTKRCQTIRNSGGLFRVTTGTLP